MINETIESVKGAAQSFTYRGKLLSFSSPDFPLAVFADGFSTIENSEEPLSQKSVASVEEHFENVNQETTEPIKDEREAIIANTHAGVAQLQFNVHNVMIPAIKAMCKTYSDKFNTRVQPDITVDVFEYAPLHSDPEFVNHLSDNYGSVNVESKYRTFLLGNMNAEDIIDFIANNNQHFSRETLTDWMLELGAAKINGVFSALFSGDRTITLSALSFLQLGMSPFNTDDILLAYLLLAAFRDNPTDKIIGESVTLEDWNQALSNLHNTFGRVLLNAYATRVRLQEEGQLVLKYDSAKHIQTQRVKVILNADVSAEWLEANSVESVLGAAVSNRSLVTVAMFEAVKEQLIKTWHMTYPIIKQASLDKANVDKRNMVVRSFLENSDSISSLVELENLHLKVEEVLGSCALSEYDNHFILFTKLVCKVTGSDHIYQEYLEAIDEYSRIFPEAGPNELETQALITVVALYMARQITMVKYTPEIDDTPEPAAEEVPAEGEEMTEETALNEDAEGEEAEEASDEAEVDVEETEEVTSEDTDDTEEPEAEKNETKDMMSEMDELDGELEEDQ